MFDIDEEFQPAFLNLDVDDVPILLFKSDVQFLGLDFDAVRQVQNRRFV